MADPFDSMNDDGSIYSNKTPEQMLDFTPITFGKYRGKTPEWVAENDPGYLRWMYETVTDRGTCSYALYRDAGGTRGRPVSVINRSQPQGTPAPKRDKQLGYFDDMDDDIPF
jgi:hypothetical protein